MVSFRSPQHQSKIEFVYLKIRYFKKKYKAFVGHMILNYIKNFKFRLKMFRIKSSEKVFSKFYKEFLHFLCFYYTSLDIDLYFDSTQEFFVIFHKIFLQMQFDSNKDTLDSKNV